MISISCSNEKTENKNQIIMIANRDSWKNKPIPKEREILDIQKKISFEELEEIKKGLIPTQMEDKWFVFTEKNITYFHRSWTGACIYEAEIIKIDTSNYQFNSLIVNRNTNEYTEKDSQYDIQMFDFLVDRLLLDKSVKFPQKKIDNSEEQKSIERHSAIGYGMSRKEINE